MIDDSILRYQIHISGTGRTAALGGISEETGAIQNSLILSMAVMSQDCVLDRFVKGVKSCVRNLRYLSRKQIVLCFGMSGTDVKFLQAALNYRGYSVPETGFFNAETAQQLRRYQEDTKTLAVDGIAGEKTFAALTNFRERTFNHE